uniref:Ovule protein n=1 Tax=Globodera rostochiensis TaxID=31243 RepID=A0A914HMF2_GLORO
MPNQNDPLKIGKSLVFSDWKVISWVTDFITIFFFFSFQLHHKFLFLHFSSSTSLLPHHQSSPNLDIWTQRLLGRKTRDQFP